SHSRRREDGRSDTDHGRCPPGSLQRQQRLDARREARHYQQGPGSRQEINEVAMPTRPLFIVDAFTAHAFAGNPAAVCLLDAPRPDKWMQSLAAEMNLSETAFLVPESDGFELRWFTPKAEVDLCGHATLASAHVLWSENRHHRDHAIRFHTRSGLLTASHDDGFIVLDFPAVRAAPVPEDPGLAQALGTRLLFLGRNGMDYLVEVTDE